MTRASKRIVQVNVKMSEEDFLLLQQAAQSRWPDAIISNSGILLGLARIEAKRVLGSEASSKSAKGKLVGLLPKSSGTQTSNHTEL
jgi:hypothetical protein